MKRLFRNINKTSLAITLLVHFFAFKAQALESVAIVSDVKGMVFVTVNGRTAKLKVGDELLKNSEILTTSNGTISFTDYFDHQFHLSNSSHVKFLGNEIQLRRGYIWTQSYREAGNSNDFLLSTANAGVHYGPGEFILTFDPTDTKSQILVIKGNIDFFNLQNTQDLHTVADGLFSYIDTDVNNGSPRAPTPVGFASFKNITKLFHKVTPMGSMDHIVKRPVAYKKSKVSRGVASVGKSKGHSTYIQSQKQASSPADAFLNQQLKNLAKKTKKMKRSKKKWKKSTVTVRVYGASKGTPQRVPASVNKKTPAQKKVKTPVIKKEAVKPEVKKTSRGPASVPLNPQVTIKKDAFEKGLSKEYKKQMRHSSEVNSLIRDLKNYDQDFKTAY